MTAKEFLEEQHINSGIENAMIGFAKMHVEAALKAASINLQQAAGTFNSDYNTQKRSILTAYSLDLIN